MAKPGNYRELEKAATVGCWRLEHDKIPFIQAVGPALTRSIMELAGMIPFKAETPIETIYDLAATFDDGSHAMFTFKPYSSDRNRPEPEGKMPRRRDEVDIRLRSIPFLGRYGATARLNTIIRIEDFRIERENTLIGGRKIIPAVHSTEAELPSWAEVDWSDIESVCPIKELGINKWLGRLGVELDNPRSDFERLAEELHLAM